jgi:hypothetical protein
MQTQYHYQKLGPFAMSHETACVHGFSLHLNDDKPSRHFDIPTLVRPKRCRPASRANYKIVILSYRLNDAGGKPLHLVPTSYATILHKWVFFLDYIRVSYVGDKKSRIVLSSAASLNLWTIYCRFS